MTSRAARGRLPAVDAFGGFARVHLDLVCAGKRAWADGGNLVRFEPR